LRYDGAMKTLAGLSLLLAGCVVYTSHNSPPGAPFNVVAVAGNGTATVSWGAATPGSSAITDYVITIQPGGFQYATTATSVVVEGLVNGQSYTFTVQAENAFGVGPGTSASAVPTGPPAEPQVTLGPRSFPGSHVKAGAAPPL